MSSRLMVGQLALNQEMLVRLQQAHPFYQKFCDVFKILIFIVKSYLKKSKH